MLRKILLVVACCASISSLSQLRVHSNGNVGVGIVNTPISRFAVGGLGSSSIDNYFASNREVVMQITSIGDSALFVTRKGVKLVKSANSRGNFTGLHSVMSQPQVSNEGFAIGVYGEAGNSGTNYGVEGKLNGTRKGAAIIGSVANNNIDIDRRYAGYFAGDVRVTQDLYVGGEYRAADVRFMFNHETIDSALAIIESLTPLQYTVSPNYSLNDPNQRRYGISGQDVEELLPLLVRQDLSTYRHVDYAGLIPLLVQAIKELNNRVAYLESHAIILQPFQPGIIHGQSPSIYGYTDMKGMPVSLRLNGLENARNMFEISCDLPMEYETAYILVHDIQGTLKQTMSLESGVSKTVLDISSYPAGIYLCSLVVDGCIVSTKKLVSN